MKANTLPLILTFLVPYLMVSGQTYTYDFSVSDNQFEGGVSDFHVLQSDQHNFTFENKFFQPPLDTARLAQYMSGTNPSDDLFMFMKKKITGLQPQHNLSCHFCG